ncbi:MAG: secondary thiamine-phosphate synthase enzyme YjbQ [Actinomycetota bacterium]|nr:secondary thiamine-phosphate synthase enzyme YjbQ [Actinomycetota bacterium]
MFTIASPSLGENVYVVVLEEFETKTGGRLDALDITEDVAAVVRRSGVRQGTALVFSPHTTCSVLLAPHGQATVRQLHERMEEVAPRDAYYAHDDLSIRTENLTEDEPANAPAHIFHILAGRSSECVPVGPGGLMLGEDQRILFVELDCSRKRRYVVQIVGE